jgi:fumarylacetoacetate (FAA) hydrolase
MKLASLRHGRDGRLAVVSPDGTRIAPADGIAPTMQAALDDWERCEPKLRALSDALAADASKGSAIDFGALAAPLPRTYEWVDGSAYINHIVLVRKARGAEPPKTLRTDPLVYQGGGSDMLAPRDPITLADPAWGCDFESEVAVILGDVPQGTSAADAGKYVRLVTLVNDVTLRNLVPPELEKGFGFFQSKPATALAPFAITPDELGAAWKDGRIHLPLRTWLLRAGASGALGEASTLAGDPDAGPEMHFGFHELIAHIAKTRRFGAGTIVGSGTVSNEDPARGVSCLAEKRTRETLESGKPVTPFLGYGDRVRIEMTDARGKSLFGAIEQEVRPPR